MAKTKTIRTYRSEVAAAVYEMVEGFYNSGLIDKETLREFESLAKSEVERIEGK
jgi:putative transcriptional regulator